MKKLLKYTLSFVLAFMAVLMGSLYIYYKYKIFEPTGSFDHLLEHYPEDLILKLGGRLRRPKKRLQHFLNFPLEKKESAIRIGAFGDSYTFGDEVRKKSSYPYYLQQLFNEHYPNQNIEVLNFGMSGAGFQEQFFLWEKYAKLYKLDYILLGPRGFYSHRDVVFVKIWDKNLPPRSRFILTQNNQLREVYIKGKSPQERYKNYYRFFPTWTALRYDKVAFRAWEILIPSLRNKIKNPFYYQKISDEQEVFQINKILLEKVNGKYNKKILFLTDSQKTYEIYFSIKDLYNLNHILNISNFYRVFYHKSSLGNEFIANVYFQALRGKTNISLPLIKCYFLKFKVQNSFSPVDNTIDKDQINSMAFIKTIQITDEGGAILYNLRPNQVEHYYIYKGDYFDYGANTKSFIALTNKDNFMRAPFIPLNRQLKEGMSIYLDKQNKIKLGEIKSLDTYNKFFVFYSDDMIVSVKEYYDSYSSYFSLKDSKIKKAIMRSKKKELFIENHKLGDLVFENNWEGQKLLKIVPEIGIQNTFLMMGPQKHTREQDFPKEFPVYIKYYTDKGKSFKSLIPDWHCKKELKEIQLDLPNFEPLELE